MANTPYPIPASDRQSDIIIADGVQMVFDGFDFQITSGGDIEIWQALAGAETFERLLGGFVVTKATLDRFSDFSIIFDVAPAENARLLVRSNRPANRALAVTRGTALDSVALEAELAELTMRLQELQRNFANVLQVSFDQTDFAQLPAPQPQKVLIGRDDGRGWENGFSSQDIANAENNAAVASQSASEAIIARDEAIIARDEAEQFASSIRPTNADTLGDIPAADYLLRDEAEQFASSIRPTNADTLGDIPAADYLLRDDYVQVYVDISALEVSAEASRGIGAIWQAGGFFYREVAADFTAPHITNAAGVKFVVEPDNGVIDIAAFNVIPGADYTIDHTPIVQIAVNFAASKGVPLQFRAGSASRFYNFGDIILGNEAIVKGPVFGSAEIRSQNKTSAFIVRGRRIEISGFSFVATDNVISAYTAIKIDTSILVDNLYIHDNNAFSCPRFIEDQNAVGAGVRGDSYTFTNNQAFVMRGGVGIGLYNVSGSIRLAGNAINKQGGVSSGQAYNIQGAGGLVLENNSAIGNYDNAPNQADVGILLEDCTAVWLNNNNFERFGGEGIILRRCIAVRAINNHVGVCDDDGIQLEDSDDVSFVTTSIKGRAGLSGASASKPGISLTGCHSIVIDGLNVYSTTGDCVFSDPTSEYIQIKGARIGLLGNISAVTASRSNGIHLNGPRSSVVGGYIRNVTGVAMRLGGQGSYAVGIYLDGGTGNYSVAAYGNLISCYDDSGVAPALISFTPTRVLQNG